MRRKLFVLALILVSAFMFYVPAAEAKDLKNENLAAVTGGGKTNFNALGEVRVVRLRGRRYKVWYRTFWRGGRRYVRIYRVQYA